MSRHIWSVKTFKNRVGKTVTVDGNKGTVSEEGNAYTVQNKEGFCVVIMKDLLEDWLRKHVVVASGYPLKRESSKPAKTETEYTDNIRTVPFNTLISIKFQFLSSPARGMFIKDEEFTGQPGVFFVSNDNRLRGCFCKDRHGFKYSYLISSNMKESAYPFKDVELVKEKAPHELQRITYGNRSCVGFLKKAVDGTYIITDDEDFAGACTSDAFKEGFRYSWWVADCNVSDIKLEPLSGTEQAQEPVPEPVQEPVQEQVQEKAPEQAVTDVLDMTVRELLELVIAKLKA